MAAFEDLDWTRIDVHAIVSCGGLTTIEERHRAACHGWLLARGYRIESWDCRPGLTAAIPELGRMFRWEEQFAYALQADNCNLDALRDGFEFDVPASGGVVFEVVAPELAWRQKPGWLLGLLSIAQEHSRSQLALGRRFFALLVLEENSPLVGTVIENTKVPGPFWNPAHDVHEFRR